MTERDTTWRSGHLPVPHVQATRYEISLVPETDDPGGIYTITVEYRGDGRWAVLRHSLCLSTDGHWDRERIPSEREDDWLAAHRFDLETAKRLAVQQAVDIAPAKWRGRETQQLADLLGAEPAEPFRHLEDGSTHTVQALTDAGESCVQQQCTAAREEARLRQEQYTLRTEVENVLDEVDHMADDERLTADAAGELRRLLRSALGLDRPLT